MQDKNQQELKEYETPIALTLPNAELEMLEAMQKEGEGINQLLSRIIHEKLMDDQLKKAMPVQYEDKDGKRDLIELGVFVEDGVTFERTVIDLPQTVLNFYRVYALANGKAADFAETFIASDICEKVSADIQSTTPEEWIDLFKMGPAFKAIADKMQKITAAK